MVVGFAFILVGILALVAGFTGRTLGETIRGEIGKGFALANLDLPNLSIASGSAGSSGSGGGAGSATTTAAGGTLAGAGGGARGIVEAAAQTAAGYGVRVVSDYRPGATTTSGNISDHSGNDANRAARDLSNARDAINGPPTPQMDAAVEAIGALFGRRLNGKQAIVTTFQFQGYRVQIIYRTPAYGGHMGHIHVGAHRA